MHAREAARCRASFSGFNGAIIALRHLTRRAACTVIDGSISPSLLLVNFSSEFHRRLIVSQTD
jgi:hypothetical protein